MFIHNNERNARLTAELMHTNCAYNLAIIPDAARQRRISLPPRSRSVDPNELFTPDIAEACTNDEQSCRDFLRTNAGARDARTVDRFVRTQFFLAIRDCSSGFSLPVVALHNNVTSDTAAYSRRVRAERRSGRNVDDLRMDIDKTRTVAGGTTVNNLRSRLRARFGSGVQRSLTEQAGTTNIFRWCASRDLSRCHIGDPEHPDRVIWTTNERDFDALRRTDVNVALQSQLPSAGSESEGDLSTLFLVLRRLTTQRFQVVLDAIERQIKVDVGELGAALEEIGDLVDREDRATASLLDGVGRTFQEVFEIIVRALQWAGVSGERDVQLGRLRYVNIETPGMRLADQTNDERVENYRFISGVLRTLGLHCCGPDPAAAESRIERGLRTPPAR